MDILQEQKSILDTANFLLQQNALFATYRFPHKQKTHTIVQRNAQELCSNFSHHDSGFLITPFTEKELPKILIKPDIFFNSENVPQELFEIQKTENIHCSEEIPQETTFEQFESAIKKVQEQIQDCKIQKTVLSRIKIMDIASKESVVSLFDVLRKTYPNAFVFLFNIPQFGCWIGASPEPIALIKKEKFQTVSLAGTQVREKGVANTKPWGKKEIDEQNIVTNFIEVCLQRIGITDYKMEGPSTQVAANLLHLKTEFTINLSKNKISPYTILEAIHPTPSVCGLPQDKSFNLINAIEQHRREFYTGLVGPQNLNDKTRIFVNLRSGKVCRNKIILYAGAGITKNSETEKEWEETEHKLNTLKSKL